MSCSQRSLKIVEKTCEQRDSISETKMFRSTRDVHGPSTVTILTDEYRATVREPSVILIILTNIQYPELKRRAKYTQQRIV